MPSAAERTRTLVQSTCSSVLLVPGLNGAPVHQLMPEARSVGADGDLHLTFAADSPVVRAASRAKDDELSAVLELTDVAPVSVPHRIRGRAWLSGWLTRLPDDAPESRAVAGPAGVLGPSEWATLRLETGDISVDDLWGTEQVEAEEFATAAADPLVEYEAELLQHLHTGHSAEVQRLRELLGTREEAAGSLAVPVALDRFGLRVRFTGVQCFDARFDFPEPVRDVHGLRRAMHILFDAVSR
ncbi:DUF2470 domain-containing protein [Streptomyces tsukubensis]|uniref:DUF2470 domain-containing protein n=1 Tax=Streptomyces tsukubensis TaxID=83656 RepID=A0A1V4AEZ2_9ACTN|nr:DUF2470 domain-containing protein [Streptomyces tsukubensis]OON82117.1 hypothetical protein B1H18_03425 [Streptomyces tsukubensis]QFR92600.1 hypothetical protein GBW32_05445 [Streptomyces tsukubensis]